jgi:hypothetical protein
VKALLERRGSDAVLVAAALVAAACAFITTSRPYNLVAVTVGVIVLGVSLTSALKRPPSRAAIVIALVLGAASLTKPPWGNVTLTPLFWPSIACFVLSMAAFGFAAYQPAPTWLRKAGVVGAVAAMVGIIFGSGNPQIDVWVIFQQAGAGLFHGVNPYTTTFTDIPAGQTAGCFNYLPATLFPAAAGWGLFRDVRWAELAVPLAGWFALLWHLREKRDAVLLAGVAMTLGGTLRVAQQGWNESLVLGWLLIAAVLWSRGRPLGGMVFLGLAFATKQHALLVIPLGVAWRSFLGWRRVAGAAVIAFAVSSPWVFANFGRFKSCTMDFFLNATPRNDSLSLWRFLPGWGQTILVIALVAAALVLCWRFAPKTPAGLLLATAFVLAAFSLVNKQTFENQWWLVSQLAVAALALGVGERSISTEQEHSLQPPR